MTAPRRTRLDAAGDAAKHGRATADAATRAVAPRRVVSVRRRRSRRLRPAFVSLVICCALFASAVTARAATFDGYRARVRGAAELVKQLGEGADPAVWESERDRAETESETIGAVRERLPARERVERAGGAVEVDNGWLHKELDAYVALAPDRADDRREKITLLGERLNSLAARLGEEAAQQSAAGARDKEAEKGRLQTILRRPEYNEEAAKGGAFEKLLEWLSNLLKRLFPERAPMSRGTAGLFSVVARVFVYALAVGLIAFLAWRYGPLLWGRARAGRRERAREARVVLGERLAPDQTPAELIAEAERLARAGDLRSAIRKAYVAVLCELGDRHLIRLAQHKTNRDYLASLRDRAELYGAMHPLTHNFERHWYGLAPASDADWAEYRALCNRAMGGTV